MSAPRLAGETHRLGPDREGAPVVAVPLQHLRFHPRNIRHDLGDLTALAESIRHEGVLVPLMAEKRRSGGLRLLHGHRRWAAADLAGLRRVPCVIVPEHTDDEAILLMLAENTGRADVEPPDLQAAVRALLDEFDYSPRVVARRLGVPVSVVEAWGRGRAARPTPRPGAVSPGPELLTTQRRREAQLRNPSPKIRPTAVHELLARWDTNDLDAAALVAELRGWLGDWKPAPTPNPPPLTSEPTGPLSTPSSPAVSPPIRSDQPTGEPPCTS